MRTSRMGAFMLVALGCGAFAQLAVADVQVTCNPHLNKVKIRWQFPCSDPPTEGGNDMVSSHGDPAPDLCHFIFQSQQNPPNFENRVAASGCCTGGEPGMQILAHGCAKAGGNFTAALESPYASVGLWEATSADSMVELNVQRIRTPGPAPDMVIVGFASGGLRTRTVGADDATHVTLKLIVYPDLAAADGDSILLNGTGSAFFGAVTLIGESGSLLPLLGFSAADFLVSNDDRGVFTALPVPGLSKVALVPDADAAVVTLVGDPSSSDQTVLSVRGTALKTLELAPPRPNPFRGNVAFRFGLPESGTVSLELFDPLGRRVRRWGWSDLPAGEHLVRWDGTTEAGTRAPAGTLMLRLTARGKSLTEKVVHLP